MVSLTTLTLALIVTGAAEAKEPDYAAFEAAVAPVFEKVVPAAFDYVKYVDHAYLATKEETGKKEEAKRRQSEAWREFQEAVAAHWPHRGPEAEQRQDRAWKALKEVRTLFSRAKGGQEPSLDREEAVRAMTKIAQSYPDSPVSEEAYFLASHLYLELKPLKVQEAYRLLRLVEASKGGMTGFRVGAGEELASAAHNPDQRIQDRQAFSARLGGLHNAEALKGLLLRPAPIESQQLYLNRVLGALFSIESSFATNAVNMVGDVRATKAPQETAMRLMEKEPENTYLQIEAKRVGLTDPMTADASGRGAPWWLLALGAAVLVALAATPAIARRLRRKRPA